MAKKTTKQRITAIANDYETLAEAFGDATLPIHSLLLFLRVAEADLKGEPLEGRDLAKKMKLSTSAISRNVASLGEWHRHQRPGMGLIQAVPDLMDRRRKPITLTKKGHQVISLILKATGGE